MLTVLYEDNHLLAVAKPAGMLTMGDATGDRTLLDAAKEYVKEAYHKPGEVFLGVVHRLDRPVSGVVVLARTSKAAARLSTQFRDHAVEKAYWAAVTGSAIPDMGELHDWLLKNEQVNRSRRVPGSQPGALECRLAYQRLEQIRGITLLELRPLTGRSHQLRVQLSGQGWPIVGDTKYGSREPFSPGSIALHAQRLTIQHPTRGVAITLTCPLPTTWNRWGFSACS